MNSLYMAFLGIETAAATSLGLKEVVIDVIQQWKENSQTGAS